MDQSEATNLGSPDAAFGAAEKDDEGSRFGVAAVEADRKYCGSGVGGAEEDDEGGGSGDGAADDVRKGADPVL